MIMKAVRLLEGIIYIDRYITTADRCSRLLGYARRVVFVSGLGHIDHILSVCATMCCSQPLVTVKDTQYLEAYAIMTQIASGY